MVRPTKGEKKPLISVVIAGHNRPDSLRETLRALREQTLPASQYEVLVIGFPPTTLQAVADENKKLAKHAFHYHEIGSRWPDAKRNEGIRRALGNIVAFTDDDVVPAPDWLEKIKDFFHSHPDAVGVEGRTTGNNTPLLSHATRNEKGFEFPACNYAFRKGILEKIGGFDEAYHFFREDTDLAYKAMQFGKVPFDPHILVFHPTRFTQPAAILRELGMTRGEIRLAKKFPKTYYRKYGIVGKGGWKQALITWVAVGAIFFFLMKEFWLLALVILSILFLIRYLISFRGRTFTFSQALWVFAYMGIRDLAYPFFFTYYWFTEHPKVEEAAGSEQLAL
ncbi:MAG: glycosyltransferase family A protein [Candidatus Diapherotrites archaeon]|nr:glycosyltransferase family A protein [Candidatus Diapherotrites archaeon]MDZ4256941.1 glycosyltransferase family A protein [archaeon]